MFEFAKDFMRKKSLRKMRSDIPTGIMPLGEIHSALALIDVEDTSYDECKLLIQAFFRENNMKGDIFFLDFKKLGDGERLITSITGTILKKDLNWFGRPSREKMDILLGCKTDLFISLLNNTDFPLEIMASASKAKFKIGRRQLPGNIFDMVISDPADKNLSEAESFLAMKSYLNRIQG